MAQHAGLPTTIDEYIAAFPPLVRAILQRIRTTIADAAPDAQEVISYRMPAFKQQGVLLYFAAFKAHIGVFPPVSGEPSLERALAPYRGPNRNLRFPLDRRPDQADRQAQGKTERSQDSRDCTRDETGDEGPEADATYIGQEVRMKLASAIAVALAFTASASAQYAVQHKVLATSKTSTMEKELNDAAEAGFRFHHVMGGESAFGGKEVVVIMTKGNETGRYSYRLLATSKTSTMQKELQEASDAGYEYRGQTVFGSTFGGDEVVVLLERDKAGSGARFDYKLIATSKTSTLEKELTEAGSSGYEMVGMTVGKTAIGGKELVAITRKTRE